ncbi:hypothetical protein B296_00020184 [Ensete ventricosum]|uniref:Uncharacterized protein n=1 Tax=Ensete ventricosum TaxID=4639 RepID=A0A427AI38_ENSVE|nr:hypothetical protein B296_00020184 [Ensete ventricosum]
MPAASTSPILLNALPHPLYLHHILSLGSSLPPPALTNGLHATTSKIMALPWSTPSNIPARPSTSCSQH